MSLQPVELLKFAKNLDCSDEVHCRAALSRAYYCAYHIALPIVQQLPPSRTYTLVGPIRHQEVADRIKEWRAPSAWSGATKKAGDIGEIARSYKAAMTIRKIADYSLNSTVDRKEVDLQNSRVADINQFFVRFQAALDAAAAA